ncbi:MAG: zinc-ribbon domain containing protein [Bryobacterales bacterium]|nr:zinc-ribbon domain containing protein [Bryobacterales bacterium]
MSEFQDRVLNCAECGAEFIFTAGEQQFFHDKNLRNEPKRCKACKGKRHNNAPGGYSKVETVAMCSQCGRQTTVPFKPTQGRPIYCRECYQTRKALAAGGLK